MNKYAFLVVGCLATFAFAKSKEPAPAPVAVPAPAVVDTAAVVADTAAPAPVVDSAKAP